MSRTKDEEDPINEEVRVQCAQPRSGYRRANNSGGGDGFEAYYTIHGGTGKALAQNIEKQVIEIGQNSRGCRPDRASAAIIMRLCAMPRPAVI
ncbi:MAG: hypothetical protein ACLSF2_04205 [Butyricicoccus sp.]